MSREEFKSLVQKHEQGERFFGYLIFLSPSVAILWFFIDQVIDFIKNPEDAFLAQLAFVFLMFSAGISWLGIYRIRHKFKKLILIQFDEIRLTAPELIDLTAAKMNCDKQKYKSGLLVLRSKGWQTSYNIFIGVADRGNELFADLRLADNLGFFSWTIKKLKKRLLNTIAAIGKERHTEIAVELNAR